MVLIVDLSDFEKKAKQLGGAIDQVPFALVNSLNTGVFAARREIVGEVWPSSVKVRNKRFLTSALRVDKAKVGTFRAGGEASASLFDTLGRAHLQKHARGGTKVPKSGRLAIPVSGKIRRTSKGVSKRWRPRALVGDRYKVLARGIFEAVGGRLQALYIFVTSAKIKKAFPFYETFERVVARTINEEFPAAFHRAMGSRRR